MKSIFTIPKVVKYDDLSKPWYIYFRYDGKLIRKKYGINYTTTYKGREIEANFICQALHQKLKNGWNPLLPDLYAYKNKMSLIEAVEFAFEKKKPNISQNTIIAYNTTAKFFIEGIRLLRLENLAILDTKRIHIKSILEKVRIVKKWSNKSYNKNLGFLKAILSELTQWDIIENNPAHKIKSLPVGEVLANIPATDKEIELIKEKLLNDFPNFYVYIVSIFHTGIRPKELLQIKLSMINLEKNEIRLPPEITKTDIGRIVPINPFLKKYFKEMDLSKFDKNFYLFGTKREFANRGLKKELDFTPGPNRLNRDCASKLWNKLINKDLNLEVKMYSMKHLGADKKILAGMDLDALRELYGHTSKLMTLRYAKVVKEVYRNQIIENSPDF